MWREDTYYCQAINCTKTDGKKTHGLGDKTMGKWFEFDMIWRVLPNLTDWMERIQNDGDCDS